VGHIINVFSDGSINKKPVKVEYRTKHAKGHYIWLETIGDLLRDDQGELWRDPDSRNSPTASGQRRF